MNLHSLLEWYSLHQRALPWRETRVAYHIWISEIILQQTRVAQGLSYYERFISRFPTVEQLASAPIEEVLLLWQGLGYYSRARNLHTAAQQIVHDFKGEFPSNFNNLLRLKGVGRYTAAAIASIAFQEKKGAVDGNVLRVVSRLVGIFENISNAKTAKEIEAIVDQWIVNYPPGDFNQAMMELGATICSPKQPQCNICPISIHCYANLHHQQDHLPFKEKKIKKRDRHFHHFYFEVAGKVAIVQRDDSDIWKGLHQLPLIECSEGEILQENPLFVEYEIEGAQLLWQTSQKLTHQNLKFSFWKVSSMDISEGFFIKKKEIAHFAFPKTVLEFLTHFV